MTIIESIKNGFSTVNRNWQLVLIQTGAMIAGFAGFFLLVGIPLAIAFIIFGLDLIDLTEMSHIGNVLRTFKDPAGILSKYFGLIVLVLVSFLIYISALLFLGIFVFAGSIGVISRSLRDRKEVFHIKRFFSEGRKLFFPLLSFTTIIGMVFIVMAFILGIFGGVIASIVSVAKEQEAVLGLFVGIFFSFILFVVGIALILGVLAVAVYGIAGITMKGVRSFASLREAVIYLYRHPKAFYLYGIIFGGYVMITLFVLFLGYPIKAIPFLGPLMSFFYQFGIYIFQGYIGLVMMATIFSYYYYTLAGESADKDGLSDEGGASEGSISGSDISEPQASGQEESPSGKETTEGS